MAWTARPGADQDFIPVEVDNAPLTANRVQEYSDGDGYGNIIDADFDNDGTVDYSDFNRLSEA